MIFNNIIINYSHQLVQNYKNYFIKGLKLAYHCFILVHQDI